MERDVPVRQVLPDLAVLGIAQRQPSNEKELSQARGVDDRFSRGKTAAKILEAVAIGKQAEPPEARNGTDDLERDLRPAVTLDLGVGQPGRQVRTNRHVDAGDTSRPGGVPVEGSDGSSGARLACGDPG